MATPVQFAGLSVRVHNALLNVGCDFLEEAAGFTEVDFLTIPNFGRKSLKELREALHNNGLRFRRPGGRVVVVTAIDGLAAQIYTLEGEKERLEARGQYLIGENERLHNKVADLEITLETLIEKMKIGVLNDS